MCVYAGGLLVRMTQQQSVENTMVGPADGAQILPKFPENSRRKESL